MGKQLVAMYESARDIGGLAARVRLANLTKIPSSEAELAPDTPAVLRAFEAALQTIRNEWSSRPRTSSPTEPGRNPRIGDAYEKIRALLDKSAIDRKTALALITETTAAALNVERASVWLLNQDRSAIRCEDLFVRQKHEHSTGTELRRSDFAPYFEALLHERTIAATNAHTDLRTAVFSEPYLKPLGINSMLDVPIWQSGDLIGVTCHEHIGPERSWLVDEEDFAYRVGGVIARVLSRTR
jgi:hypothetical protein